MTKVCCNKTPASVHLTFPKTFFKSKVCICGITCRASCETKIENKRNYCESWNRKQIELVNFNTRKSEYVKYNMLGTKSKVTWSSHGPKTLASFTLPHCSAQSKQKVKGAYSGTVWWQHLLLCL